MPPKRHVKNFIKMGISEKIIHSNTFHIYSYKEGVFWIAYEQSAYYFWQQRGYKPTKKFVKSIGREIVSVGFPQNAMDTFSGLMIEEEANKKTFILEESIDSQAFKEWKDDLPLYQNDTGGKEKDRAYSVTTMVVPSPQENHIIRRLHAFPLADKTPMECMMFLSELQKQLIIDN
jgi:hypothetical protein